MAKNEIPTEAFSEDPQENLKIENELLKIKMQAETGAVFSGDLHIPPQLENIFLRQVQQFEQTLQSAEKIKLYDLIGRPAFKKAEELTPAEVNIELNRIFNLMAEKSVFLDTIEKHDPTVIYKFIIEELFEQEVENVSMPGWIRGFIYEEFYPPDEETNDLLS